VYVLHFEPAYGHARHYIGWTRDLKTRMAEHRAGTGSPLIRAALAAGVRVDVVATMPGSRYLERRLKRWHKTGQFCPVCRAAPGRQGALIAAAAESLSSAPTRQLDAAPPRSAPLPGRG
jgi:predicted GIY-YIG superfamily endonuclease